ncbi:hypothetical protein [Pelomonas sp. Root1444]|uniref:hypothetical protein n=1 Tax=Pelomonas sp. Root1444 TaxID=1736464 RepID=UPI0012FBD7A6|nr:hypothetical protein [Pelomonas sp. Root1444]
MNAAMAFAAGPSEPRRPKHRPLAAFAVLGAHLVLLWALWQLNQPVRPDSPVSTSIPLRFVPDRKARAQAASEQATPTLARMRTFPVRSPMTVTPVVPSVGAAASTDGEAAPSQAAISPSGPSASAPGSSASASGPLTLTPSREVMLGSLSNPATSDPRSNTPRPTFEERIAMALDPELCVKLERLPNGKIRRRMGKMVNAQSAIQNTHGTGPHGIKVCQ